VRGRRHGQRHHHRAALTPLVAGVDVGLRAADVVLLEGARARHVRARSPDEVAALLREHRPACVAIDGPPRFRPPGTPVRAAERELLRRGVGLFVTPPEPVGRHHPFYAWMRASIAVWAAVRRAGYPPGHDPRAALGRAVETFPHAVAVCLHGCVPPRQAGPLRRAWRAAALRAASVDTAPLRTLDALDAALCALCAARLVAGEGSALGGAPDGAIMLPVREPPERFPACA
jgi:predicted nuclease with RNAse H fold